MPRLLLAAVGLLAAAAVCVAAPPTSAADYFADKEKDLGVVAVGPALVHYFPITNTSKNVVTMGSPRIQCGCVGAYILKGTLEPGETTFLVATMNTTKIPETQKNTNKSVSVSVPFTSPVLEEVTVLVKCFARTDMIWSPADGVAFGTVKAGKASTATMKVTLFGSTVWDVTEVESNGAFIKAASKQTAKTVNSTEYEITCTLDAKAKVGNWMTEVLVKSKTPGLEKIRIPVTVNVEPAIAVKPGSVDLGVLPMGGSKTVDVLLSGIADFKIVEVKGSDDVVSAVAKNTGAAKEHTLKFEVKATTAGDLGRRITVVTDSKEQPEIVVPVSGVVRK